MAVDMFLTLDGIDGESVVSGFEDTIDILAWSWGASQTGTMHMAGGGGAGKANFQDVSITKYVDKSSHKLLSHVAKGTHISEAKLSIRKAGNDPLAYVVLTMTPCMISSVSTGGSNGEERLTENITINFAKFTFEYTPQKEDGSGDAVLPFCFNIEKNVEE